MAKEKIEIIIETSGGCITAVLATPSSHVEIEVDILDHDDDDTLEGINAAGQEAIDILAQKMRQMDRIY